MDTSQARITELQREAHLLAMKEVERLNLRIVELENQTRQPALAPVVKPAVKAPPGVHPVPASPPAVIPATLSPSTQSEILNEHQVAEYVQMSVAPVRRWRVDRKGPNHVKMNSAVQYKRGDVETWPASGPDPFRPLR
jgi:predicted DNA-binding transcriptional regulator AlpA